MNFHELQCDVLVAGGGAAGVPCAVAAARAGVEVILCQDRPVLGGNASSEVRMHIVGANATGSLDRGAELETEAREGGIIEEIRLENTVRNPQRSAAMFDLILYEKCRAEPNLTLMLNTTVISAEVEERTIVSVRADRQSTEDQFQIVSQVYVDCTGDGRLAKEAGAVYMEGREDQQAYQEDLAVGVADQQRLGSTILLQARRHEQPMPFVAPPWARSFSKRDLALRLYATPGEEEPTHEYGYWWAEWGGTLDTIKDNELIRDELLAIALGIWNHVKNGPPEDGASTAQAENWALDWIGFLPGKRESRRFIGQYVLTQDDIMTSRKFSDAVAYGGWSLDLHPPGGIDAVDEQPCEQHAVPNLYDIPLRCCVAQEIINLMFAGRNMSATHVAFSSTRVMATCAVVGQGVGLAAAYAIEHQLKVTAIAKSDQAMQDIQQRLLRSDAFLIGLVNDDYDDLARQAEVTASSEQAQGEAMQVISGVTRAVHGERGVCRDRCLKQTHRWMSNPASNLPAWIELAWDQPVEIGDVQLVFDTGQHRHLTLTHHDGYSQSMQWGRAPEETVADYSILVYRQGEWVTIENVVDNYQRLRRHPLNHPTTTDRLRVLVHRTNGLDHARIMEIRVYQKTPQSASS